jgi:polar amino acid transport system substrate-binding protein
MKQLVQSARNGGVTVIDVPPPQLIGPGVLVRTAVSLISAGTERAATEFAGSSLVHKARRRPDLVAQVVGKLRRDGLAATVSGVLQRLDRPLAPGYAAAGTVIAASPDAGVPVGERVACAGATYATHGEINYVPRNLVVPIPRRASGEWVAFDEAAFATVGAIALHGVRLGRPQLGDRCVVIGLGVIGLLAVQILRAHGCRVVGVDPRTDRCALARVHGADAALAPAPAAGCVAPWTGGLGADLIVITAASDDSAPAVLATELARDKGRIVGVGATGLELPRRAMYQKELSLVVSRSYGPGRYDADYEERGHGYPLAHVRWTERENMRAFLDLVADDRVAVRPLMSARFAIEEGERAYAALMQGESLGIVLEYPDVAIDTTAIPSTRAGRIAPADGMSGGRIGVSVIGAGQFARGTLLPSLRQAPVNLRGVCAATGLSARSTADAFGFAYCSTAAADVWSDEQCHAVIVATRHDTHARIAIDALEAGKAVLVEKPLCINEAELSRIEQVLDTLGSVGRPPLLMVGFNRRFAPAVALVRAQMRSVPGPLSIVYRINAGDVAASSWIRHPAEGGGRIVGEVCHFVDLCAYVAGSDVSEVSAIRSPAGADEAIISLRMANGSIATIAYLTNGPSSVPKERIEVFGGGRYAVIDDFRRAAVSGEGGRHSWGGRFTRRDKGHAAEVARFIAAVATGADSPVPVRSALNTTRATFAVLRSLEHGGPVTVA